MSLLCARTRMMSITISRSEASILSYLISSDLLDKEIPAELLDYISAYNTGSSNMVSQTSSDIETQKNKEKCRKLLNLSSKIRYVGIINEFGRTLAGQLRRGVIPLFKVEEARNEFFIEATRNHLRGTFEDSIGKLEFTLTANEKVTILTIPGATGSGLYYFTFDKGSTFKEVLGIAEVVKRSIIEEN